MFSYCDFRTVNNQIKQIEEVLTEYYIDCIAAEAEGKLPTQCEEEVLEDSYDAFCNIFDGSKTLGTESAWGKIRDQAKQNTFDKISSALKKLYS